MGLIKSHNTPPSITTFSMKDVEDQARALLVGARRAAERLLAEAQQEADVLRDRAKAEGLAEGRREGLQKGTPDGAAAGKQQALAEHGAAMKEAVAALTAAMQQIEESRQALATDALQDVIQLSVAIARRVTKRQGLLDPQVMLENLQDAMRLVVHASDVRVVIHPAQRAVLDDALPALRLEFPQLAHVSIIEEAGVAPGGCRVLTKGGQVDAELDAQLDRVVGELLPTGDDTEGVR